MGGIIDMVFGSDDAEKAAEKHPKLKLNGKQKLLIT